MGQEGMKLVNNVRDDDLFLMTDGDEVPFREPLLFLKLYDGYTVPVAMNLRWTTFRFYWLIGPLDQSLCLDNHWDA